MNWRILRYCCMIMCNFIVALVRRGVVVIWTDRNDWYNAGFASEGELSWEGEKSFDHERRDSFARVF